MPRVPRSSTGAPAPKHDDDRLIDALGGTRAVANLLDVKEPTVSYWRYAGIPDGRMLILERIRSKVVREYRAALATRAIERRAGGERRAS